MFENAPPSAGEVRALAHQLMTWADHLSTGTEPGVELTEEDRHDVILALAVAAREARRLRAAIFPAAPLGNPTWEVMLDLFIQEVNGFRTSLDHLALTGDTPAAIVYESVAALDRLGLVERSPDRFDGSVHWLSLTVTGRQGMFDLFEKSAEFVRPISGRMVDSGRAEG